MTQIVKVLSGKKTYILAALTIVWAWVGFYLKIETFEQAMQLTATALIGAGLRSGIAASKSA